MTFPPTPGMIESWVLQAHVMHSIMVKRIIEDYLAEPTVGAEDALRDIATEVHHLAKTLERIEREPLALFAEHRQESADHLRDNLNEQEV